MIIGCNRSAGDAASDFMRNIVHKLHLYLGIAAAIPVLFWSVSGFLYALPNTVEGGTVEKIAFEKVKITPDIAAAKANQLAGKQLPTTAMTLLMRQGRPVYQSIGGLGADSIFIDAETGEAYFSPPPSAKTRFFREAHFYFFAGRLQVPLLLFFSALAGLSAISGIYLNIAYWLKKIRRQPVGGTWRG